MNRLANATSPYLLQHASNPVDWWPWCEEAFAEAARRDVPVLLSVGYAACHWCHVMAHESFEDPQTAALLNEHVVAIKVDREERPDVDAVYMTATQAMTGRGGWPMTVFMTPQREPFFCGTYFHRDQFRQLVLNVSRAWRGQRDDVTGQARQIAAALAENTAATVRALRGSVSPGGTLPPKPPPLVGGSLSPQAPPLVGGSLSPQTPSAGPSGERFRELTRAAVAALERDYDAGHGGFGGAPKFPPSMVLEFLLRHHQRTGAPAAAQMAEGTMEAMARGGMYDQLGGGFARYSVDAAWVVPHFEKMLYDNALLARVYAHHWRRTSSELARRVAEETCDWMLRELRTPDGGLAASLDADSEGEEGRFYVWRPAELRAVLGPAGGEFAAAAFGVTADGTFERGASVLQRRAGPPPTFSSHGGLPPAFPPGPSPGTGRLNRVRAALLAVRDRRARPARDDKVVTAWNGLAVSALAECGLLLGRPDFVAAADGAAALLAAVHLAGGRLVRASRNGTPGAGAAGVLEDYACTAEGFLVLCGVTGQARWLTLAGELIETALSVFGDEQGGFYDTAADGEPLIFRPADPADNATPSGTFAMAGALLGYAALTGSARHREAAQAALGVLPGIAGGYPRAAGAGLAVAEAWLAGPPEIAIVGSPGDPRTGELHRTALHAAPPGTVLALGDGAQDAAAGVPLLAGRGPVDGAPAAYVCRQFTCQAPVTTPDQLRQALAAPY